MVRWLDTTTCVDQGRTAQLHDHRVLLAGYPNIAAALAAASGAAPKPTSVTDRLAALKAKSS